MSIYLDGMTGFSVFISINMNMAVHHLYECLQVNVWELVRGKSQSRSGDEYMAEAGASFMRRDDV